MFNDCCLLYYRVAFRCEEYRIVVSFNCKSNALYAKNIYSRGANLIIRICAKKRTKIYTIC